MRRLWIVVLVLLLLFACGKPNASIEELAAELDYDEIQMIILNIMSERHTFVATPFITYELLGIEHDTFYERFFVWALLDDIDSNLNVHSSYSFLYAFTFDRVTGELVRYFYPDETLFDIGEIQNHFPLNVINQFYRAPQDVHIERVDRMRDTNIWNAKIHFEIDL